jgi:protein dithiol oxidoreductase (disulfide-forming)
MRRRALTLGLAAAGLAPAARAQGAQIEGKHYVRLGQALPTTTGRIEVVEFFLYTCPACYALDPLLETWAHQQPADVSLRRVPVGTQLMHKLHQRMFYTLQAMGAMSPAVHAGIFNAFHRSGAQVTDEAAAVALVGRFGVDTAKFKQTLSSFAIQNKVNQGLKLAEQSGADGVPTLVVAGRWRTGPAMAGQQTLAVVDFLIQQARAGKTS